MAPQDGNWLFGFSVTRRTDAFRVTRIDGKCNVPGSITSGYTGALMCAGRLRPFAPGLLAGLVATAALAADGALVLDLAPRLEADRAGVREGDRLLAWSVPSGGTAALPATGSFVSPLDVGRVQIEHGSRVPVVLTVERAGTRLALELEPGTWGLAARPPLEPADLERFLAGWRRLGDDDEAARAALAGWSELAAEWRSTAPERAFWLDLERAQAAARRNWIDEAQSALAEAQALAEVSGDPFERALVLERRGFAFERASRFEEAAEAFRESLEAYGRAAPESLVLARAYENAARVAWWRDRLDEAEALGRDGLAIRARIAPDGLPVAESFNDLGLVAWNRGDLAACESFHRRALEIREREAPRGLKTAYSLVNLGIVTWRQGSLGEAEAYYRRAIEVYEQLRPDSVELARAISNLAIVHLSRGHLVEAEALLGRALGLQERWGNRRDVAHNVTSLAEVRLARGDRAGAKRDFNRALAIKEELGLGVDRVSTLQGLSRAAADPAERRAWLTRAREVLEAESPDSYQLAGVLLGLADVTAADGDAGEARTLREASLRQAERVAPGSVLVARILTEVGRAALDAGDAAAAEETLGRALDLLLDELPGDVEEAETRRLLAGARRARGNDEAALAMLASAERVLDGALGGGGTIEERARARAAWAEVYLDQIDLLARAGQVARAFDVSERYRTRGLRELVASRDLQWRELPAELDRRRQMAESRWHRLVEARREAAASNGEAERAEFAGARRELNEVRRLIAERAPRIAPFAGSAALDSDRTRRALAADTLLLSYVVGRERTWLFAVDAEHGPELHVLDAGRAELERRVRELRDELSRPSRRSTWRVRAATLSRQLLGPVADRVLAAGRILVLPDGPLHFLPFAALAVPGAGNGELLVALRPVFYGDSMTALAELEARPRTEAAPQLVAFADPFTGPSRPSGPSAGIVERGLRLEPLAGSREEAERIRALFPGPATVWIGEGATEERAKALGEGVSNLHFACHGLVDPASPLDSGLALAAPGVDSTEDGVLQAWEIFEQLRIDARLVVLSACDTALGEELPGEGVLGLVRAFRFAGARGVVATQWRVGDRAAAALSSELYAQLRQGIEPAEALRRAQLTLTRRPETAHPSFWAAFGLFGTGR